MKRNLQKSSLFCANLAVIMLAFSSNALAEKITCPDIRTSSQPIAIEGHQSRPSQPFNCRNQGPYTFSNIQALLTDNSKKVELTCNYSSHDFKPCHFSVKIPVPAGKKCTFAGSNLTTTTPVQSNTNGAEFVCQ